MRWVQSWVDGDYGSWCRGTGHVLAEQGWVLGDRIPFGAVEEEHGGLAKGVGTDSGGEAAHIWGQDCGFGSHLHHVAAV